MNVVVDPLQNSGALLPYQEMFTRIRAVRRWKYPRHSAASC